MGCQTLLQLNSLAKHFGNLGKIKEGSALVSSRALRRVGSIQLSMLQSSQRAGKPFSCNAGIGSAPRATTGERCRTGNCAAVNGHFNPLVNFPVNGGRTLRLSQATGDARRSQLRGAALFGRRKPAVAVKETVVPDPDYRISVVLLGAAGAFVYSDNLFAAVPVGLLGLLLLVQTTRVKFVFDNDSLEVKIGDDLGDSGDNVFVGGENRWKYSSFINWEFWWPNFPVLVYFRETQTKPEGQIHFFPVIFNGKQVYDVMVERCGASKTSGPK